MAKLYVIHDTKLKVDLVPFLHHVEGAAKNHFVQYAQSAGHSDLALYSIVEFDYFEDNSLFNIQNVDRFFIMNAPVMSEGENNG